MPPKKKAQPNVVDRLRFSEWVVGEMQRVMKDKGGFNDPADPQKGNFVDHALLFGPLPAGIKLAPTSSPARLWRVTPQEHITRLARDADLDIVRIGLDRWEMETTLAAFVAERRLRKV